MGDSFINSVDCKEFVVSFNSVDSIICGSDESIILFSTQVLFGRIFFCFDFQLYPQ